MWIRLPPAARDLARSADKPLFEDAKDVFDLPRRQLLDRLRQITTSD